MKCFRRCLCVFCCLALLSVGFSIPVNAVEYNVPSYHIYASTYYDTDVDGYSSIVASVNIDPTNNTNDVDTGSAYFNFKTIFRWWLKYEIATDDGTTLIEKGGDSVVVLLNTYDKLTLDNPDNDTVGVFSASTSDSNEEAIITYTDGTTQTIRYDYLEVIKDNEGFIDYKVKFVPEKDVKKITIIKGTQINANQLLQYSVTSGDNYRSLMTATIGEIFKDSITIQVDQQSEEAGLLAGLIGWVTNIFNKITSGFDAMAEGFTNIINSVSEGFSNLLDSIIELPAKLWQLISDGLKSLFVPDEEFIVQFKDDMDSMLENKLGAVYQVANVTFESWEKIQASDKTNTIKMPKITINLPDNAKFSFGGYDVQIVPEFFEGFVEYLKIAVGGVCTVLFFNGLRKRYDEIMGVEQ